MVIREAQPQDWEHLWPLIQEVARAGETYGYDPDISPAQAYCLWMEQPQKTYVAARDGQIVGTYYLKPNQGGPGRHVCNCGYIVAKTWRGQGIGRQLGEHSLRMARALGYKAMQFNFVAASNQVAIHLWQKLGFEVVGRLPKAFLHPRLGYIDALVMYQWLGD
ncbi:MAG: GNAT family N-acetyltransferase [Gloeomargarita sp. SKYBB_i_bin120]|nr:GNAT family N-acetyltransferase [Gloeomargarita sp. SKYG98]MCS7292374.1 GNAT family N-acetyltransferase [Gloeomargarita sp. SKYB120]MDW8177934.1 GNAT family N-acetyltransferase [Gloeomargarita sp. SKYBB_i_bin120]